MSASHGTGHIIQSLVSNLIIAVAKGIAAFFTGSGAMLAETLHSLADCGNQVLLLIGVKRSQLPPDAAHPLGYGRNVYFWSFMVALLLFSGGGVFSIYEGIHKLRAQGEHGVENAWIGYVILGLSLAIESWATWGNIKEMKKRRGAKPFLRYIRETKDSDLVVVFGENAAAVIGLLVALLATFAASALHIQWADAVGTLVIGVVLVGVAVFLAVEVKSLLIGESADADISAAAHQLAVEDPRLQAVISCITVQQGPGEVVVALKIRCEAHLTAADVSSMINEFEARLRARCPEARWIFVEPDLSLTVPAHASGAATAATG
jgi:cation diffusion facilitator family transporter